MSIIRSIVIVSSLAAISVVEGAARFLNVQVTLRGKKYDVSNVETVSDIQKNIEELSGLSSSKQGVLFGGKKLKSTDVLEDVGIEDGSMINIVPTTGSTKKKSTSSTSKSTSSTSSSSSSSSVAATSELGATPASSMESMMDGLEEMLKSAGIDKDKMQDMLGPDGKPDMMKSMEMMQKLMNSPAFKDFIEDPDKLEQSRQMILQNPMMKGMLASLPGFGEIINDKEKWRETMLAAVSMYQNMGTDMMKAMASMSGMGGMGGMGGLGGMGGMGGMGGFGGLPDGAAAGAFAGLDELSEGEM